MNNRFTEEAQQAIAYAHEILQQKQHTQLDVEHILLALLKQPDSTVARILQQMQVDVRALSTEVDAALSNIARSYDAGYSGGLQIYITMRVKRLFEVAAEEADRLNNNYISTEHLFLAVVHDPTGPSGRLLREFGIDQEKVNNAIWHIRNTQSSPSDSARDSTADRQRATPADTTGSELHTVHTQIASLEKQTGNLREDVNRLVGSLRENVDRLAGVPAGMIMLKQQIAGLREQMQTLEQKVDKLLGFVEGKYGKREEQE